MKRLITYTDNSYMPLWQTDLKFVQDNMIQVLTGLGKTFGYEREDYIVSGCLLSILNNTYHVTEGLVMIGGELLYVPAQTVTVAGMNNPYIVKQPYLNPEGEKQFLKELGTEFRSTWDDNYGKLQVEGDLEPSPGRVYLVNAKTITDMIIEKAMEAMLTAMHRGNTEMSLVYRTEAGYAAHGSYQGVLAAKNAFGDVMITAAFTASAPGGYICTLPAGFRPVADIAGTYYSNNQAALLKIRKDGKVVVAGASTSGVNYISFQYNILHNDYVQYNLPEGGGGATEGGGGGLAIPESMRIIHETGESTLLTISGELEIVEMMINRVPYSGIKGDTFNGMDYKVRLISGNTEIAMNPQLDLKFVNGDIIDIKYTDAT
jgi:hypothetical protein